MIELVHFTPDGVYTVVPTAPPGRSGNRDSGYLYALEFESGLVKVGRAARMRDRVTIHRKRLAETDGAFVRGWVSPAHHNYVETEKSLIAAGHALADRWRGVEYLYGAALSDLADVAEHLTYDLAPPPAEKLPPVLGPHLDGLLRSTQVADLLGVERRTIKRWLEENDVRSIVMSGTLYVPGAEVARYLRKTRVSAAEVARLLEGRS